MKKEIGMEKLMNVVGDVGKDVKFHDEQGELVSNKRYQWAE